MLGRSGAGGHLPALQTQAPHTRHGGPRTGAGTAGRHRHGTTGTRPSASGATLRHGRGSDPRRGHCRSLRHHRREDIRGRTGPQHRAAHDGTRRGGALEAREGQGGRGSEVFGLLRRRVAAAQHLVAPVPGHASRRRRGDPAHLDRCRHGAHHRSALPPVHTSRIGNAHIYGGRRGRLAQAAHPTVDRDRAARGRQREGRRRGNRGIRRKPAAAAPFGAAGAEARDCHRPRIPHGLQSRRPGLTGQPRAQYDHLPAPAAGPLCRSGGNAVGAGGEIQGRSLRNRRRYGGARNRAAGARPGTGRSRGDIHGQRGRRIGLLGGSPAARSSPITT